MWSPMGRGGWGNRDTTHTRSERFTGDQDVLVFQERIRNDLARYLQCLARVSPCTLEEAAEANIEKLMARRAAGTVKGDGNLR